MLTRKDKLNQFVSEIAQSVKPDTNWKEEPIGTGEISIDLYDELVELMEEDHNITHFLEAKQHYDEKEVERLENVINEITFYPEDEMTAFEMSEELMNKIKTEFSQKEKRKKVATP